MGEIRSLSSLNLDTSAHTSLSYFPVVTQIQVTLSYLSSFFLSFFNSLFLSLSPSPSFLLFLEMLSKGFFNWSWMISTISFRYYWGLMLFLLTPCFPPLVVELCRVHLALEYWIYWSANVQWPTLIFSFFGISCFVHCIRGFWFYAYFQFSLFGC